MKRKIELEITKEEAMVLAGCLLSAIKRLNKKYIKGENASDIEKAVLTLDKKICDALMDINWK